MSLLQLKLLGCTLKRVFLQLYCPLRRQRERLSPERWLLLAIVPAVVALLVALVVCLLARGPAAQFVVGGGIAIIIAAAVYALLSIQASFFGPSFSDAEQALISARDRQAALRTEIAYVRRHFAGGGLATRPLAVFEQYELGIECFCPDGRILALMRYENPRQISDGAWTQDYFVELWDLGTGKCRTVLDAGDGSTRAGQLCFSPDGRMLAVARRDDTIQLLDVRAGQCVLTLRQPHGGDYHVPKSLAFAPNGTIMASAFQHSYDNRDFFYYTIDLWDLTNGRCIASFPPFDGSSGDLSPIGLWLAFDPAGRFLFVAGNQVAGEPWVQLFESGTGNRIGNHKVAGDRSMIWKIQFDERGRLGVLVGSMKWYLKFFDLSRFGQLVPAETHPLTTPLATRTLPLFSWDFTLTAFSVSDACSEVCATSTGGTIVRVAGVPNAFSPDNQMLVTLLDKTFFGKEAYGLGLWAIPPQGEVV